VVDWRKDALPKEPGRRRPAVVVDDHGLFPNDYPNVLVVPLTPDEGLAHAAFAERIDPDGDNGVESVCWAVAHHVTSASQRRVHATQSRVSQPQLVSMRQRIALALGMA